MKNQIENSFIDFWQTHLMWINTHINKIANNELILIIESAKPWICYCYCFCWTATIEHMQFPSFVRCSPYFKQSIVFKNKSIVRVN